jgi:phage tail sheath protein FI
MIAIGGYGDKGLIPNVVPIDQVAFNPDDKQMKVIYNSRVNPIIDESGSGIYVMGQKTLQNFASSTDRLSVRFLFIFLGNNISNFSRFVIMAKNNESTRAQWRARVNPFLDSVLRRGGIDEYYTVCDDSNNTAEVRARNEFIAYILIRPTPDVEFVKIVLADIGGTLSVEEALSGLLQ